MFQGPPGPLGAPHHHLPPPDTPSPPLHRLALPGPLRCLAVGAQPEATSSCCCHQALGASSQARSDQIRSDQIIKQC
jgi:hypothetical protein